MKKSILLILAVICSLGLFARQSRPDVSIDPPHWWAGMQEPVLQLMLHGDGIGRMTPSIDDKSVKLQSYTAVESPNYLILYLDVADARPGKFDIKLTDGKKQYKYPYELRQRRADTSDIGGFTSADVLYLIMPDRFANGNPDNDRVKLVNDYSVDRNRFMARHGGDLKGIQDHLDYFDNLGVTAIWLNPVLINDARGGSYHGYFSSNLYRVDPRLGTNEEYVQLIDSAHAKGLKVVMDMIFNHIGPEHVWNRDLPASDWFNMTDERRGNHALQVYFDPYASDYDAESMKTSGFGIDVNQRNPHVAKYLIQNSIWWIEEARIDGIRQDTYPYADYDMMREWNYAVEREYPQFNIVGEVWIENPAGSAWWQRNSRLSDTDSGLKSVMDFKLMTLASPVFLDTEAPEGRLGEIYSHMAYDYLYPDIYNVLRFLDNHDTDRFLREPITDLRPWKQAAAFLLTIPGIPQLYYGHELLMSGHKNRPGGDANVRLDFPGGWEGDSVNWFNPADRTPLQQEAYDYISSLLHWRRGNDVIARGSMTHYKPQHGVYVYDRTLGDRTVMVLINGADKSVEISMPRYNQSLRNRSRGREVVSGEILTFGETFTLEPKQVLVVELEPLP